MYTNLLGTGDTPVSRSESVMRMQASGNLATLTWFGPALLGVLLIGVGVLILIFPQLIIYAIAAVFMLGGCSMLGVALRLQRGVSYHRIDAWDPSDGPPTL